MNTYGVSLEKQKKKTMLKTEAGRRVSVEEWSHKTKNTSQTNWQSTSELPLLVGEQKGKKKVMQGFKSMGKRGK